MWHTIHINHELIKIFIKYTCTILPYNHDFQIVILDWYLNVKVIKELNDLQCPNWDNGICTCVWLYVHVKYIIIINILIYESGNSNLNLKSDMFPFSEQTWYMIFFKIKKSALKCLEHLFVSYFRVHVICDLSLDHFVFHVI